jgi:hypothetical protein
MKVLLLIFAFLINTPANSTSLLWKLVSIIKCTGVGAASGAWMGAGLNCGTLISVFGKSIIPIKGWATLNLTPKEDEILNQYIDHNMIIHAGTGAVLGFAYGIITNFVAPYYEKKLAEKDLLRALCRYSRASGCNERLTNREYEELISLQDGINEIKPDWMKVFLLKIENTQTHIEEEEQEQEQEAPVLQEILVKKLL